MDINFKQFNHSFTRNIIKNCQLCQQQFGLFKREHICKKCFVSVCQSCSPYKPKVYRADRQHRLHRMCKWCWSELQAFKKYVNINKLRWGQQSQLSKIWIIGLSQQRAKSNLTNSSGKQKYNIDINSLWKSLNFSLRELIGIVLDESDVKQQDIIPSIKIVLGEISQKLQGSNNYVSVIYMFIFFMMHASLQNSILLTCYLYKLIRNNTKQQHWYDQVLNNIQQNLEDLDSSAMETYRIRQYLSSIIDDLYQQMTINKSSALVSIELINNIFNKRNLNNQFTKSIVLAVSGNGQLWNKTKSQIEIQLLKCKPNAKKQRVQSILRTTEIINRNQRSDRDDDKSMSESPRKSNLNYSELVLLNQQLSQLNQKQQAQINNLQSFIKQNKMKKYKSLEANDEIDEDIEDVKDKLKILQVEYKIYKIKMEENIQSQNSTIESQTKIMGEQIVQITKLNQQNQNLKNTNKLLMLKLAQLSTLIMDKQQKILEQYKNLNLTQPKKSQNMEQCAIF